MNRRRILAVLLTGQVMANIDTAIVNVAAPSIRDRLAASGGALQLSVSGYVLTYAVLLITGARLGEMRGPRRMFLVGLGVFTVASLACTLAPDPATLVVARLVQGVGAALMVPQVFTGIQLHFTGAARTKAVGMYVAALSGGAVAGQVLGGVLVAADLFGTGWRPVFAINVPVGVFLLVWGARVLPADRGGAAAQRLDLCGVAVLSAALFMAVVPLVLGRDLGWPVWVWICLAASVPTLALFVFVERRVAARGGHPVVELRLLPIVGWSLTALVAATATYFCMLFVLALYLQQGLGHGPLYSGLALVSWVAAFGLAGPLLRRVPAASVALIARLGAPVLAVAYLGLCVAAATGNTAAPLLVILLGVGGLGLGLQFGALMTHMSGVVPTRYAADLSGLSGTASQLSGVAGVATFGSVYLALSAHPGRDTANHAFTVVTLAFAVTSLLAAGAAARATRRTAAPAAPTAPTTEPAPAPTAGTG